MDKMVKMDKIKGKVLAVPEVVLQNGGGTPMDIWAFPQFCRKLRPAASGRLQIPPSSSVELTPVNHPWVVFVRPNTTPYLGLFCSTACTPMAIRAFPQFCRNLQPAFFFMPQHSRRSTLNALTTLNHEPLIACRRNPD